MKPLPILLASLFISMICVDLMNYESCKSKGSVQLLIPAKIKCEVIK